MARVHKVFYGSDLSETQDHEVKVFSNSRNELYMEIWSGNDEYYNASICFDLETALEFRNELSKQIRLLTNDSE